MVIYFIDVYFHILINIFPAISVAYYNKSDEQRDEYGKIFHYGKDLFLHIFVYVITNHA